VTNAWERAVMTKLANEKRGSKAAKRVTTSNVIPFRPASPKPTSIIQKRLTGMPNDHVATMIGEVLAVALKIQGTRAARDALAAVGRDIDEQTLADAANVLLGVAAALGRGHHPRIEAMYRERLRKMSRMADDIDTPRGRMEQMLFTAEQLLALADDLDESDPGWRETPTGRTRAAQFVGLMLRADRTGLEQEIPLDAAVALLAGAKRKNMREKRLATELLGLGGHKVTKGAAKNVARNARRVTH
jgi:hypothetical protein